MSPKMVASPTPGSLAPWRVTSGTSSARGGGTSSECRARIERYWG